MPPAPEAAYGPVGGSPGGAPPTVRDKWRRLHRNCKVISCYGFLFHFGWSTWERNVFPVFLAKSHEAMKDVFLKRFEEISRDVLRPMYVRKFVGIDWADFEGNPPIVSDY